MGGSGSYEYEGPAEYTFILMKVHAIMFVPMCGILTYIAYKFGAQLTLFNKFRKDESEMLDVDIDPWKLEGAGCAGNCVFAAMHGIIYTYAFVPFLLAVIAIMVKVADPDIWDKCYVDKTLPEDQRVPMDDAWGTYVRANWLALMIGVIFMIFLVHVTIGHKRIVARKQAGDSYALIFCTTGHAYLIFTMTAGLHQYRVHCIREGKLKSAFEWLWAVMFILIGIGVLRLSVFLYSGCNRERFEQLYMGVLPNDPLSPRTSKAQQDETAKADPL